MERICRLYFLAIKSLTKAVRLSPQNNMTLLSITRPNIFGSLKDGTKIQVITLFYRRHDDSKVLFKLKCMAPIALKHTAVLFITVFKVDCVGYSEPPPPPPPKKKKTLKKKFTIKSLL